MFFLFPMVVPTRFIFGWNNDFTTAICILCLMSPLYEGVEMANIMLETLFLNVCYINW